MARIEQTDNRVCDGWCTAQCINNRHKPVSKPGLTQIAEECAEQRHLTKIKTKFNDQLVKSVILSNTLKHACDGALNSAGCGSDCRRITANRCFKYKFLNMAERATPNGR